MAEKVQVDGGGEFNGAILKNAATEATLERIADAMEAKEKGAKDKILGLFTKTVDANVKAQNESTSAFESFTSTMQTGTKVSSKVFDTLSSIAGTTLGTTFSLLTTAGITFYDFLKNGYTAFQQTSDVGAAFNNDLVSLRLSAAEALIPLDEFTKIIGKNSETFSRFGGSVTEGARIFSGVAKDVKETFGNELTGLGYSLTDLNEGAAAYLDTQSRIGRVENRTSKDLAQSTRDYLVELDKITKLTGVSRKAQEDIARKAAVDPIIQSMLDNATDMNKALANISLITKVGGEDTLQMFKEMAAGNPGEEAKMLMSTIGMSMEEARQMFTGDIGVEGVVQRMKEYAKKMEAEGLKSGQTAEAIMARNPGLAKINKLLNAFERLGDPAVIAKEQNNREKITEFFGVFGNTLNTIYNDTIAGLIDSPVFFELQQRLEELSKIFIDNSPKITEFFKELISGINYSLNNFITTLKDPTKKLPEAIGVLFKDLFSEIGRLVGPIVNDFVGNLFGETPEQKKLKADYAIATPEDKLKMEKEYPELKESTTVGFLGNAIDGLKTLISYVPSLTEFATFFGIAAGGTYVAGLGLAVGISEVGLALSGLAVELGGGLAAGLTALTPALAAIAVPALAVGAAIGMGAGGLGFAFKGLAAIIDAVSNTFTRIKDFFVGMEGIDSKKLASVGDAVKPLAEGVAKLTSAGFQTLISGGGLEMFADSIQKFSVVDASKIQSIGPALKALYDGVSSFNQGSILDNVGGAVKTFFTGGTLDQLSNVVTKLNGITLDTTNITNISNFIETLSKLPNVEQIKLDVIYNTLETLSKLPNVEQIKLDVIYNTLESLSKYSNINLTGINVIPMIESINSLKNEIKPQDLENALGSIKTTLETFQINPTNIDNAVSAIGKLKTSMISDFVIESAGIDNFNKSINTLIESLESLEGQMKKTSNANINVNTNENSKRMFPTDISGNSPEDLQKQLNMKVDELISHIVEMKQISKDTSDTLSDRNNAV